LFQGIIKPLTPIRFFFVVLLKHPAGFKKHDRVANVIEPLINHTYKYLPVVDDEEHLVGIVTRSSLVSLVQEQLQ
jgi:osmoprotectant transport system ATP-binding protein